MSDYESSDFITDDESETFDYEDFIYHEEESSREITDDEVSDTFLDNFDVFPITAHRQKYIIRIKDYEYY